MLTCGVAGLGTKWQDFDTFVVGTCSEQLSTVAPGHTVNGTFVVFVPLKADDRLLFTGPTEDRRSQETNYCQTS